MIQVIDAINRLYKGWSGQSYAKCAPLPSSGSDRRYFRLTAHNQQTVMAAYNSNTAENEAYFAFSQSFINAGINVPKILSVSADRTCYLLEDLGSEPLYNLVTAANGTPCLLDLDDLSTIWQSKDSGNGNQNAGRPPVVDDDAK